MVLRERAEHTTLSDSVVSSGRGVGAQVTIEVTTE